MSEQISKIDNAPFRGVSLDVVRKADSVCAWCRYFSNDGYTTVCLEEPLVTIHPIEGRVTRYRYCQKKNPEGRCERYKPSWFTRIAWWRRVP